MMDTKAEKDDLTGTPPKQGNLRDSNSEENNLLFTDEYKQALELSLIHI